jgi:hypothetical protein
MDLFSCDDCESARSPAAYLVDILHFLNDRPATRTTASGLKVPCTAKDTLFSRRPDLGETQLTCTNTNRPVPYVDLVNEVLENTIAPASFTIDAGLIADLDLAVVTDALKAAFATQNIRLSSHASVDTETTGLQWRIVDVSWELVISNDAGVLNVLPVPQTGGTEDELSANPERINTAAYNKLAGADYPWDLPFNLVEQEAPVYLGQLGVQRHELMEAFEKRAAGATPLINPEIAMNYLGLTQEDLDRIAPGAADGWKFWGFSAANGSIPDPSDRSNIITGPWSESLKRQDVFLQQSGMQYAEFSALLNTYFNNNEAPDGSWAIWPAVDPARPYDLSAIRMENLGPAALAKMHRFVRLYRRLGWNATELDKTIKTLGAADLTMPLLLKISHIKRLCAALNVSPVTVLSWWQKMDTLVYFDYSVAGSPRIPSLYDNVFLNKAVLNPGDDSFTLVPDGTELKIVSPPPNPLPKLSEHTSTLTAALDVSATDVTLMIQGDTELGIAGSVADALNLANLSTLYRIASFARALGLSIRELLTMKALTSIDPFDGANTENTQLFVEAVRKLQATKFSVDELNYLLRDRELASAPISPDVKTIELQLATTRAGLAKIASDSGRVVDLTGELLAKRLAILNWPAALIQESVATLGGTENVATPKDFVTKNMQAYEWPTFVEQWPEPHANVALPDDLKEKIYYSEKTATLQCAGVMTSDERTRLLGLPSDQAFQDAVNALYVAPTTFAPANGNLFLTAADAQNLFDGVLTPTERFGYVLSKLQAYLRDSQSKSVVKHDLGSYLKLDAPTIDQLLQMEASWKAPGVSLMTLLLDDAFVQSREDITLADPSNYFKDYFKGYYLLWKAGTLVTRLKIKHEDLSWILARARKLGWLDLNALPVDSAQAAVSFESWQRLVDAIQLRNEVPTGAPSLFDILAHATDYDPTRQSPNAIKEAFLDDLIKQTNWLTADVEALLGAKNDANAKGLLGLTIPAAAAPANTHNDYADERAIIRLRECFRIMKRLGASAELCNDWAQSHLADSEAIRLTVKSKYSDPHWKEVAQPLRDVVREARRKALVSYLVAHPDAAKGQSWQDTNGLYEHLLIDVEMSPCQMTSRIKQAIATVQLFTQRCLMNLEPDVITDTSSGEPADDAWQYWEWMKTYRVWDAAWYVFQRPEDFLEPELRDDKSPFFKDLENELQQNDVTMDVAEDAFLNYLEKLDTVARLEICGLYHEVESNQLGHTTTDVLHVFGRTRGVAPHYYYRRRVNSATWTPWEKVDVDIEGEHLVPVVWNRRVHLFWPIFKEENSTDAADSFKMPDKGDVISEHPKVWSIQIGWSEYKNGKWTPKRITKESVQEDHWEGHRSREEFYFRALPQEDGSLLVRCYRYYDLYDSFSSQSVWPMGAPFLFTDSSGSCTNVDNPDTYPIFVLSNTEIAGMFYKESVALDDKLHLPNGTSESVALAATPGPARFRVMVPHVYRPFAAQDAFFFEDDKRTYFVIPRDAPSLTVLAHSDALDFGTLEVIAETFIDEVLRPAEDRLTEHDMAASTFLSLSTSTGMSEVPAGGFVPAETIDPGLTGTANDTPLGRSVNLVDWLGEPDRDPRSPISNTPKKYLFETFYHPYVTMFVRQLNRDGLPGLLQLAVQRHPDWFLPGVQPLDFSASYKPATPMVARPFPSEEVSFRDAYALYNWELFFHAPLLIADRLMKNQLFGAAQKFFHFIFDPTRALNPSATPPQNPPQCYWQTQPFNATTSGTFAQEEIGQLLDDLAGGRANAKLAEQVHEWRQQPFNPHLIARLRTTAYPKNVVMKYIDNLIAWGDQLFRRDTIEAINEATNLYVLAAEILGRRPESVPPAGTIPIKTYNQLEQLFHDPQTDFSDVVVNAEQIVPGPGNSGSPGASPLPLPLPSLQMLYFCVPQDDKLLAYWDTVADRLFKIRHCMNIEGVVRQLPLFEPPIDPALLVRAATAGIDISSALNDINAALPYYRFSVMAQKATELCSEVKSLGSALLSALEKQDAEALALLRSEYEIGLLTAVRDVKANQVKEASATLDGLTKYRAVVEARHEYYSSREFMNALEIAHMTSTTASLGLMAGQVGAEITAGVLHLIPEVKAGSPTTIGVTYGGANIASAVQAFGSAVGTGASIANTIGSMIATMGGYQRRSEEWQHQGNLAALELQQIDDQILAATIRQQIAEKELENHDVQIDNAKGIDEFMHDKFTNHELYSWMVGQVSGIYFQSYQLAYDVAKRAERAYRYELGLADSNFIQFGYWDSLKKGLLAGDRLHHDLKRMEVSYLDLNKREYEITKHVSLAMLDPTALIMLRATGACHFTLPESLFDSDFPGHHFRRVKSVSLTVPCVAGPYTSLNCTLTQLANMIRVSTDSEHYDQASPKRFRTNVGAIQSIATSSGQNDSGVFELNLRDERYCPFEGSGAISDWRLEMPLDTNAIDPASLSDVIVHLRLTTRDGGEELKNAARTQLQQLIQMRLLSARQDFSGHWYQFLSQPDDGTPQTLTINIGTEHFRYVPSDKTVHITDLAVVFVPKGRVDTAGVATQVDSTGQVIAVDPNGLAVEMGPAGGPLWLVGPAGVLTPTAFAPLYSAIAAVNIAVTEEQIPWQLKVTAIPPDLLKAGTNRLDTDKIEDFQIRCSFQVR